MIALIGSKLNCHTENGAHAFAFALSAQHEKEKASKRHIIIVCVMESSPGGAGGVSAQCCKRHHTHAFRKSGFGRRRRHCQCHIERCALPNLNNSRGNTFALPSLHTICECVMCACVLLSVPSLSLSPPCRPHCCCFAAVSIPFFFVRDLARDSSTLQHVVCSFAVGVDCCRLFFVSALPCSCCCGFGYVRDRRKLNVSV